MRIGFNLSGPNYWTAPCPFIDHMRSAGDWATSAGLPYVIVPMADPGTAFVLLYDGTATFNVKGGESVVTKPGRIDFTWDTPNKFNGQMQLIVRSGTPTNLRMVRADQLEVFEAGEIFAPDYLGLLKGCYHFRTMDWLKTNGSLRTEMILDTPAVYSFTDPVSLEVIVALANKLGQRPWINLPAHISDAGIIAAFDYLEKHLKPGIIPAVEFSNEVWLGSFEVSAWATAQGAGHVRPASYFYGVQVARVAKLARGRWIGVVAMEQSSDAWITYGYPAFIASGGLDSDLEAIGNANYIHGDLNQPKSPVGPALLAANDIPGALANVAKDLPVKHAENVKFVAFARAHGWKYWTYEGGNYHLNTRGFGKAVSDQLRPFYQAVQESPSAPANLSALVDQFFADGGDAMMVYNLSQSPSENGYFGVLNTPATWAMYRAKIDAGKRDVRYLELLKQVEAIRAELIRLTNA